MQDFNSVLCVWKLKEFISERWHNELFEAHECACVWEISCSAVGWGLTLYWDLISSRQLVTTVSGLRLVRKQILTEVSGRTWNVAFYVEGGISGGYVYPHKVFFVQMRACDTLLKGIFFCFCSFLFAPCSLLGHNMCCWFWEPQIKLTNHHL